MRRAIPLVLLILGLWALVAWTAPASHAAGPADSAAAAAWADDLGPALERARAEGKDVLVDFTGSDWCGWCIRLHDEVFGREAFLDAVGDDFVFVALDFPREGGSTWRAMDAGLRERNAREARAFDVKGFPTVLLMTAEGVAYGRTGYRKGGALAYAEHVDELRAGAERAQAGELLALLQQGDEAERLAAAYDLLGATATVGREPLYDVIAELDPDDGRGVLAGRALADVEALVGRAMEGQAEWTAVRAACAQVAESTPSVTSRPIYHAYVGLAAVELGDGATAREVLGRLRVMDGVNPGWLEDFAGRVDALGG